MGFFDRFKTLAAAKDAFKTEGEMGLGEKAKTNDSGICYFGYDYDGPTPESSYGYEISAIQGGNAHIRYTDAKTAGDEPEEADIDGFIFKKIESIYKKHRAARWEGYSMEMTEDENPSSFFMNIAFNDGRSMSVSGKGIVPEGFRAFRSDIRRIVRPVIDEMRGVEKSE